MWELCQAIIWSLGGSGCGVMPFKDGNTRDVNLVDTTPYIYADEISMNYIWFAPVKSRRYVVDRLRWRCASNVDVTLVHCVGTTSIELCRCNYVGSTSYRWSKSTRLSRYLSTLYRRIWMSLYRRRYNVTSWWGNSWMLAETHGLKYYWISFVHGRINSWISMDTTRTFSWKYISTTTG